jgi:hypothetical protein
MADPSVADLKRSFELHLRAENRTVRTVGTYLDALQLGARFLEVRGVEFPNADGDDDQQPTGGGTTSAVCGCVGLTSA